MNNDGLVDLYHFRQLYVQQENGTFVDQLEEMGLEDEGDGVFGGVFGDHDDDGWLDLFVEALTPPSTLFRNQPNGTFSETGFEAEALTQGSVWGDVNADGWLDLFVGSDDGENELHMNRGPAGRGAFPDRIRFEDVSASANVTFPRNSYGVSAADYDRDGDLDIFIAPCHGSLAERSVKVLLRNDGGERFTNVAEQAGVADSLASWGVVWLDYDNDGWQDLYIANVPTEERPGTNKLYRNDRQGGFVDVTEAAGVGGFEEEASYSVSSADFNNDGWTDLYVVSTNQVHRLYRNDGDGTFTNIGVTVGFKRTGVAVADVDNDGWIDLFLPSDDESYLLLNEGGTHHWLKVRTRGKASNFYGVGARVEVYAGALHQVREIRAGDGMTSQNHNLTAHVGLEEASRVDSVVVRWPSGQVDRLGSLAADQDITVVEGLGLNQPPTAFRLLQPANGSTIPPEDEQVRFTWEPAEDPEDERRLTYTLYLTGPDVEEVVTDLTEPFYTMDASELVSEGPYRWRVVTSDGHSLRGSLGSASFTRMLATAVEGEAEVPQERVRLAAYPNPFRQRATIRYEVLRPSQVTLSIHDVLGREVAVLVDAFESAGEHAVNWRGQDGQGRRLAPGVYYCRVEAGSRVKTQSLVLAR